MKQTQKLEEKAEIFFADSTSDRKIEKEHTRLDALFPITATINHYELLFNTDLRGFGLSLGVEYVVGDKTIKNSLLYPNPKKAFDPLKVLRGVMPINEMSRYVLNPNAKVTAYVHPKIGAVGFSRYKKES